MGWKVDHTPGTTFVNFEVDCICRTAIPLFIPGLLANYNDTVSARFLQSHMNMVMSRLQDCLISMRIRVANDLANLRDCQPADWQRFEHRQRNCTIHVDPYRVSDGRIGVGIRWHIHGRRRLSVSQRTFDVDAENIATVNKMFPWWILPENGQIDRSPD